MPARTTVAKKIYKVNELTKKIKTLLEDEFPEVWVEGEISNFRKPSSGHIYFTLKDSQSQIKCVFFRGNNFSLRFKMEDGQHVLCYGKIGVYQVEGQYQLYVVRVEPKGLGALQLAFEQLKNKLQKQGLFDQIHKKPLVPLPKTIGIVTSATGAAVRDMINILRRRAPFVKIIIRPSKVQGEGAADEIASGIEEFNEYGLVDTIIISRGGGSLEDLWAFNEEVLAKAIFKSKIPIISAVGHQIDYTISDFVADVRAATPSEAAEIVVQKKEELLKNVENLISRIRQFILNSIRQHAQQLDENISSLNYNINHIFELVSEKYKGLKGKLILLSPLARVQKETQLLNNFKIRLANKIDYHISISKQKFISLLNKLEALSPLKVLSRGYSISLHLPTKKAISDINQVKVDDEVKTIVGKGHFISRVTETRPK